MNNEKITTLKSQKVVRVLNLQELEKEPLLKKIEYRFISYVITPWPNHEGLSGRSSRPS